MHSMPHSLVILLAAIDSDIDIFIHVHIGIFIFPSRSALSLCLRPFPLSRTNISSNLLIQRIPISLYTQT